MASTSQDFFNKNNFKQDKIFIEIWEPEPIVLPIPENSFGTTTQVKISVLITNRKQHIFPFVYGGLAPELLSSDGSLLRPHKQVVSPGASGEYNGIGIPHTKILYRLLTAELTWQNNCLQLQGAIGDYPTQNYLNMKNSFFISPLHPGTYQLRFTYQHPKAEFLFFDQHSMESNLFKQVNSELLSTSLAHLVLLEPVRQGNGVVELNGISFETLMPEKIVKVSPTQINQNIPVQIGVKITNNTSKAFRFCSFNTLEIELIGESGRIPPQRCGGSLGWVMIQESHFYLSHPGESVTFFPKAYFVWQSNNLLSLTVAGGSSACWKFDNIPPGKYQMQLTYRSLTEPSEILFDNIWMGKVFTPYVEFELILS